MLGLLTIIDDSGERDVELTRERMTLGYSTSDSIRITGDRDTANAASISWDSRRATWILYCPLPLSIPISVNRRAAAPGEQIRLANLDVIDVPGASVHFQRILATPLRDGKPVEDISLESSCIVFGRGDPQRTAESDRIDLDPEETSISRVHASIEREGNDYFVIDRSRLGTELNGIAFTRERLVFGDRLQISGYIFEFTGTSAELIHPESSGTIAARDISVQINGKRILDHVSVNVAAGEFIGVLGGSGHGKTTLLNALCGINPPTSGEVRLGGVPLSDRARLREIGIGYVPQDDIVHTDLTVIDAIMFSAKLRLKLPQREIDALVSRVIARLGLTQNARQRVADLSGGQRKRVSIAIELLAKPSLLFLDEPSSGLDPANEEALMTLLQSLTLTKLTVVCTTHVLQKAYLFDRILVIQSGKLVFAGHVNEARRHFLLQSGIEDTTSLQHSPIERIYGILANPQKTAADWEVDYRRSPLAARATPPLPREQRREGERQSLLRLRVPSLTKFRLLMARQWLILKSEFLNVAFAVAQPIIIGFLIAWVADKAALRMFLCIVATMWFGCSNGAQQIVSELPIFRRERVSGQGLNVYILSKLGFLSLVSVTQAALLLIVALTFTEIFHPEETDAQNITKEFAARLAPAEVADQGQTAEQNFDVVDSDNESSSTAGTPPESTRTPKAQWKPSAIMVAALVRLGHFFQISQNLLDSGPRPLNRSDGTPLLDSNGHQITIPGESIISVLIATLGLKWLSVAAAAVTSVAIGLTISSLVRNPTQAVLWVPLVLIPQILFGGVVVAVPDMSSSVRFFSHVMPSFAAQKIMDTGALYGSIAPFLTNRTKTPLFLTSRGEKETIEWTESGRSFSQSYDKLSPVNTSWQNMEVIPERLGQHKEVGDRIDNRIEYRDTIDHRRDVRLSKGTGFSSLYWVQVALGILIIWNLACYATILWGLMQKQTGR